jgi:uncharacterized membrane protein
VTRRTAVVLAVAAALRLLAIALSDREVADVERYRKVAEHVLGVSWNPYQAPRLYPYPPLWVWVEAGAAVLAKALGVSFAVLVKLPTLAADLFIVGWLARRGLASGWFYALHPVSVMVGAVHGQFDATALAFVLGALGLLERGQVGASALALAAAIGLKAWPVLLLPLFLLRLATARARVRYVALALVPVGAVLLPYLLHDAGAVRRELFGYGGVADFGWIGLWRGVRWWTTGALASSAAARWEPAVTVGKLVFLAAYAATVAWLARRPTPPEPARAALLVTLLFLTTYGALSAQYLLWIVPLAAAVRVDRWAVAHGAASTLALAGFYLFLAPGVLTPATASPGPRAAGLLWVAGTAAVLLAGVAWLAALHRGRGGWFDRRAV